MEYKFIVTKKFINGLLKGMTIRERTNVSFTKGRTYKGIMSSSYLVLDVKRT